MTTTENDPLVNVEGTEINGLETQEVIVEFMKSNGIHGALSKEPVLETAPQDKVVETEEEVLALQKIQTKLSDTLSSRFKSGGTDVIADSKLVKRMLSYYASTFRKYLNGDEIQLLSDFGVSKQMNSDADYCKFMTAMKLITSMETALKLSSVIQLLVTSGIVYSCQWIGNQATKRLLADKPAKRKYCETILRDQICKFSKKLNNPEQRNQFIKLQMLNKIQNLLREFDKTNEIRLGNQNTITQMVWCYVEQASEFGKEFLLASDIIPVLLEDSDKKLCIRKSAPESINNDGGNN
jgi:hypothetical protein